MLVYISMSPEPLAVSRGESFQKKMETSLMVIKWFSGMAIIQSTNTYLSITHT